MTLDYQSLLNVAIEEARQGLAEGGIPIGAALFDKQGNLLGRGHNRRVQDGDPSVHGETDAFRKAGRQFIYRDKIMVTTLAPCWYCSGLIRQFRSEEHTSELQSRLHLVCRLLLEKKKT